MTKAKIRKTMVKENTAPEVVENKVEDTFLGIKTKNILKKILKVFYCCLGFFFGVVCLLILSSYLYYIQHYLPNFCETITVRCYIAHVVDFRYIYYAYILSIFYFICISKFFKLKTTTHKLIKNLCCYILAFGLSVITGYVLKYTVGIRFCTNQVLCDEKDPECRELMCVAKPIIYLYPTKTTEVSIKLGNPQKLTHTYPKYVDEWTVRAEPNGDLFDMAIGRHYYSLYWEGKDADLPQYEDGFVVAKDDVVPFLEEKLALLGLNEREANEFIIYWLPKLESAPYTFIHFVSIDEQNENMPLEIKPKADTVIRVLMAFKSLEKPIKVVEQVLPATPIRDGFTAVEWGGTEIGTQLIK